LSHLQDIKNQVKAKLLTSIVEGGGRFPAPSTYPLSNESFSIDQPCSAISRCMYCPLHEERKRVVVAYTFSTKMYFVLSDFPDKEDEASSEVYSIHSPLSSIAINLLKKLEIQSFCHYSFALKCFPERGLLDTALEKCAKQNLLIEISTVMPKILLCFGYRALHSLISLDDSLKSHHFEENKEGPSFHIGKHTVRLFFLSSFKDLKDFPRWRKQVWNVLYPLTKKHSTLS
jgi:uracil-DNA glycosylase